VGFEWVDRSRISRIREALGAAGKRTIADSCALQTDTASQPARRLRALLGPLTSDDADIAAALALLKRWNARLDVDSAAALLFELWWMKHLRPALLALLVPDAELRKLLVPMDMDRPLDLLEKPDTRFGGDPEEGRDALLLTTLKSAFAEARERQGADASAWAWGKLHHGCFEHALSAVAEPALRASLDAGPFAKGGSSSTPMHTGYRLDNFRIIHGASFRLVVDVGNWDASLCMNSPGQSGDPRSPHYRDLAPLWAKGEYVPLAFSREAVDAAAEVRFLLKAV
jgi:penicillin amidase